MKRLALALALASSPVLAQQPNWLPGVYTLAPGPDNIYANLAPAAYCYNVAWVVDRPGSAGFMVSDCINWISDTGPPGTPGADGKTVRSGTGVPSLALGVDGDFYVDVSVYRIYGPKTSGIWGSGFSLIGPTGAAGTPGTPGSAGAPGSAATVTVGSVSTGVPGSGAAVTNIGTSSAAILNFSIPRGDVGATGPSGPAAIGTPASRSVSLATAYQATDSARPAMVTVNLTSTASISLTGGTTNVAEVVIGATNAVVSGTGTAVCRYANSNTGALTIGLNLSTISAVPCSFSLPVGWYFAVRQTSGTVTITSTFDQPVG